MSSQVVGYFEYAEYTEIMKYILLKHDKYNTVELKEFDINSNLEEYDIPENCYYNEWMKEQYGSCFLLSDIVPLFMRVNITYLKEDFEENIRKTVKSEFNACGRLRAKVISVINTRENLYLEKFLRRHEPESYKQFSKIDLNILYTLLDELEYYNYVILNRQKKEETYALCLNKNYYGVLSEECFTYFMSTYRFYLYILKMGYVTKSGIASQKVRDKVSIYAINSWEDLVLSKKVDRVTEFEGDFESGVVIYTLPSVDAVNKEVLDKHVQKWKREFAVDGIRLLHQRLQSRYRKEIYRGIKINWLTANIIYRPNFRELWVRVRLKDEILELRKKEQERLRKEIEAKDEMKKF